MSPPDRGVGTTFQIMPPLTSEEYAALEQSIAKHGVLTPVVVDENDTIIDGHHRQQIASKLGVFCPRRTIRDVTEQQKIAMSMTLNIDRRHLTREQRRELLAMSLKVEPEASDREHGRRTATDHKTAAKVRSEMEGRGEIPHADKRTDTAGRKQPVSKTNGAQAKTTKSNSGTDESRPPLPLQIRLTAIRNDEWTRFVKELGHAADTDSVAVRLGKAGVDVTLVAAKLCRPIKETAPQGDHSPKGRWWPARRR